MFFGGSRRGPASVLGLADGIQLFLQRQLVEGANRQTDKNRDAVIEHSKCIGKSETNFGRVSGGCGRIGKAPMRGHRLARPHRARFRGRVITKRERKIELGSVRTGELLPVLGT